MKRYLAILASCTVLALAVPRGAAAGTISGTWSLGATPTTAGTAQLELKSKSEDARGTHDDENAHDVTLASIDVSDARLNGPGGHLTFTLARDAGNIVCDGWAGSGTGSGRFTFTPNAAYAEGMRSRGAGSMTDREQLGAAMLDLSLGYVDGIVKAGFSQVPFHDLLGMRALGVTPDYIAQMKAAGVAFASPRETIEARALRVDPGYVREMSAVGYPNLKVRQLVELRALRIDADYVRKVASHGFRGLTVQKLVEVKATNVI
jgi:hypothetical protein